MKIVGKHREQLAEMWGEEIEQKPKYNVKAELRKELNGYKKKYPEAKNDIKRWEEFTGKSIKSHAITESLLNDCIMFIINEQLGRERKERESRGGII